MQDLALLRCDIDSDGSLPPRIVHIDTRDRSMVRKIANCYNEQTLRGMRHRTNHHEDATPVMPSRASRVFPPIIRTFDRLGSEARGLASLLQSDEAISVLLSDNHPGSTHRFHQWRRLGCIH